jgi:hypothetical protein
MMYVCIILYNETMDEQIPEQTLCPACHVEVRPGDYFCFNCGKNLHSAPPSMAMSTLLGYSAGSVVLPPMGIIWGIRYIGSTDTKAKIFGLFLIFITIAELVLIVDLTIKSYNMINDQIQQQLPNIQGL